MLTYEAISEDAERRGMPKGKTRGIIREYLQTLMLKHLYGSKWKDGFFLLGGTSLRLLYGLKRFSEDLDFNTRDMKEGEFEDCAKFISNELRREGIESGIRFSHRHPLLISEFIFKDIQRFYGIFDKRTEIIIKLEANSPDYGLETETGIINGFGELFLVNAMSRGSIFADKIDTLRNKKRGRHIYDIIFMLSKKFPVDRTLLRINGIEDEPKDAILSIIDNISDRQLEKLSKDVAPFLFDETESGLIKNSKTVVRNLLGGYEM